MGISSGATGNDAHTGTDEVAPVADEQHGLTRHTQRGQHVVAFGQAEPVGVVDQHQPAVVSRLGQWQRRGAHPALPAIDDLAGQPGGADARFADEQQHVHGRVAQPALDLADLVDATDEAGDRQLAGVFVQRRQLR